MIVGDGQISRDGLCRSDDTGLVCEFHTPEHLYSLRAAVAAHATEHGMGGDQVGKLLVVATELATNAIRHGGGHGRLRLWRDGNALHCQVTDDGPGIGDPRGVGRSAVPVNSAGGRGLWLIRQLSDQLTITSNHPGTTATATLHL